jgi:hypothetical protein
MPNGPGTDIRSQVEERIFPMYKMFFLFLKNISNRMYVL